jgi:hypothetical protein
VSRAHTRESDGYRGEGLMPVRGSVSTAYISVVAISLLMMAAPFSLSAAGDRPEPQVHVIGGGVGGAPVSGESEIPAEPAGWDLRPCCRTTDLNLSPADGTTLRETLCRLSIETALRTVDDALSIQEGILTGNSSPDAQKLLKLRDDLRDAKNDLAVRRRTLAADALQDKEGLMRNMKNADRVVQADLAIQAKLLKRAALRDGSMLLKRVHLVRTRLEKASAEYRDMVAGVDGAPK